MPSIAGYVLPMGFAKTMRLLRGAVLTGRIRSRGGDVGRGLQAERGVWVRRPPHKGLSIGSGVYLGRGCILEVPAGATLSIGRGTRLMHYALLGAAERIEIGEQVLIGERVSVRDQDHGIADASPIMAQPASSSPVVVGDGAWIGAAAVILRGSALGEGCVVGANSVVKGSVPASAIVVGAPARVIGYRGNGVGLADADSRKSQA
jgi:acetyltransferase-like isoleucine patch superfamily enzyme